MASNLRGLREVVANLNREIEKIEGRTERGVFQAATMIAGEALPLTPKDLGPLRGSQRVTSATTADGPIAAVSYGTVYARRQHEDLSYRHTVGEAKFLEKAINRNEQRALRIIASEAKVA